MSNSWRWFSVASALCVGAFFAGGCSGPKCPPAESMCYGVCINLLTTHDRCGSCDTVCGDAQACVNGECQTACPAGEKVCKGECVSTATDANNCGVCGKACASGQQCVDSSCACPIARPDACGSGPLAICTDFNTDPEHCGSCDNACSGGELCVAGKCEQSCSAAQPTACPASKPTYCANTATDANNCGGCNAVCPAGQQCVNSSCTCPGAKPDACGTGAGAFCTDVNTDPANCGACGNPCGTGQLCVGGKCEQSCSAAQPTACPADQPTYCANTATDANNCGGCNAVCPAGQQCVNSSCTCPGAKPDACGTGAGAFCTDVNTDPANCGACGNPCGTGQLCVGGKCEQSCSAAQPTACPADQPTYCANTATDANNCGGCNTVCPAGQQCVNSSCTCPGAKPDACGTGPAAFCTDLKSDPANCGTCGNPCSAGQLCSAGKCELSCQQGLLDCNGTCVDPLTSSAFCGATADCTGPNAGVVCASGQVCVGGTCQLSCQQGLLNCNGTCIDPLTSNTFCGATDDCTDKNAGVACQAGQICSNGTCGLSCQKGLLDCNGTCIDPLSSNAFCGATGDCTGKNAGTACPAGQLCSTGTCQLSCQQGLLNCNGTCVDPLSSRAFCGATGDCTGTNAGVVCDAGQVCTTGVCQLSCQSGLTNCNGTCADLASDPNHCGKCSTACTTGLCASETCQAIVIPSGGNLDIQPAAAQIVGVGNTIAFTVTPAADYQVSNTVEGTCPVGSWSGDVYTTGAISANCSVVFDTVPYFQVTPSGTNVTITPSTVQDAAPGGTITFNVTGTRVGSYWARYITVGGTCPTGKWTTWTQSEPSYGTYQTGTITSDCTVTFNGSSCPYVATWNGSTYVVDNDIYSTARYPEGAYRDYLELNRPPVIDHSEYKLEIAELENESSWTDFVQLDAIDHAPGVKVSTDMHGDIVSYASPVPPVAARSGEGADVMPQLDAAALDLRDGGSVVLEFPNVAAGLPATLVLKAIGFLGTNLGTDFPHPPAIAIQTREAGHWVTRATFKPHVDWSTQAYDLSAYLGHSSLVRLVASSCNAGKFTRIGFVGLDTVGGGPVTVTPLSPIAAWHSTEGDVLDSLLAPDGNFATLTTGEDIKLAFPAPPLVDGMERDFVFVAQGYYIPQ